MHVLQENGLLFGIENLWSQYIHDQKGVKYEIIYVDAIGDIFHGHGRRCENAESARVHDPVCVAHAMQHFDSVFVVVRFNFRLWNRSIEYSCFRCEIHVDFAAAEKTAHIIFCFIYCLEYRGDIFIECTTTPFGQHVGNSSSGRLKIKTKSHRFGNDISIKWKKKWKEWAIARGKQ